MKSKDYDFRSAQMRLASRHTQNQAPRMPTRNIRMTGIKMGRSTQIGFNKNSERLIKAQNRLKNKKIIKSDDPEQKMVNMEQEIQELMDSSAVEEVRNLTKVFNAGS